MNIGYRIVKWLLNFLLNIFFQEIIIEGENIPNNVPIVIAGDHRNFAIDGAILTSKINRQIHFMAKAPLFKGCLGVLFRIVEAIPIKRRQDQQNGEKADNTEYLYEAIKVLQHNECFGIFPEGLSHSETEFQSLKPGVATISIRATTKNDTLNGFNIVPEVFIIPTGLNYTNGEKFRSKCIIHFGTPIVVTKNDTVSEVMEKVEKGLRMVTVNAPDLETSELANTTMKLYLPDEIKNVSPVEQIKIKRNLLTAYISAKKDDTAMTTIKNYVGDYHGNLKKYGINDYIVKNNVSLWYLIPQIIYFLIGTVLFTPFIIIHWPVCIVTIVGTKIFLNSSNKKYKPEFESGKKKTLPGHDMIATYKIGFALMSYIILHMIYFVASVYQQWGILTYLLFCGFSVVSSYVGIMGYEIIRKSIHKITMIKNIPSRSTMKSLNDERNCCSTKIKRAVNIFYEKNAKLYGI